MGSEVTQKDLQSLQGYVNKKVAEVDAAIKALEKSVEASSKKADAAIADLWKAVETMTKGNNAKNERLIELEKRMGALEK